MQVFETKDIRNLALVGHGGSGKTTLGEAMLASAKVIDRLGSVEAGNTVSDYHADEQKRQISINASLLSFEWLNKKLNVLDTPGYSDFIGEVHSCLSAADMAVSVISCVQGLEVGTEQTWEMAEEEGIPRLVVLSALDKEHTHFDDIIESAKERLSKKIFPVQIPVNAGPGFNQIADVIRVKLLTYKTDGSGEYEESELTGDLKDKIGTLHQELIEFVAESDDALLEKFFEQGGLSEEDLQSGMHDAVQNGSVIPAFAVAAASNVGVVRLMDFIARYGATPLDRKVPAATDGGKGEVQIKVDNSEHFVAYVFKTVSEAHVGDMSLFRIWSGHISTGDDVYNSVHQKGERLGQLYLLSGKTRQNVAELNAGDIGTVVKLKNTKTCDTLCDPKHIVVVRKVDYPRPNVQAAIKPKSKGDEDKIGTGLGTLRQEDPTFHFTSDLETKEMVISGQGELHLQVNMGRLKERFGVEVELHEPRIPFRETIRGKGDSKYRHKKQTGGAGQFAEVWMTVESLPRGSGVEFTESLVGQNVDRVFVPSVEKGVRAVCEEGVYAGYHIVDVKVNFYDGKMHPVDSKDIAFQIAGKEGFREAFLAAKPCLLEPIFNIEVKVPEEYMGDVMGDISSRRGKIQGMDNDGHYQVVKAQVPQANLYQYATSLRSLTGGRGIYKSDFSHYEQMPPDMEQKVIAQSKKSEEKS